MGVWWVSGRCLVGVRMVLSCNEYQYRKSINFYVKCRLFRIISYCFVVFVSYDYLVIYASSRLCRKTGNSTECSANFKTISVNCDTTAQDVLKHITPLLNCTDVSQYSLIELCLDKGVNDREIAGTEKPLQLIQMARRVRYQSTPSIVGPRPS